MNQKLGLVICGLGSAGQSRLKAAPQCEGIQVIGTVSRRPGISTLTLEEALKRWDADAFAVSTENTSHAELVEKALLANKHVLCDYPLAFQSSQAKYLFDLARKQNKVLHVEHLALLSQVHGKAKEEIAQKGKLISGEYIFQGNWNSKLADPAHTGPCPFLAVSRLVQVSDLFGPFTIGANSGHSTSESFRLELTLHFQKGGSFSFLEERKPGLGRRREMNATLEGGSVEFKSEPGRENLFFQDLCHFRDRINHGIPCYYNEEVMVRVLAELEKLSQKLV